MRPDWLNDMPSAWTSVPFGSIFTQSKRKNSRLQRDFVLSVMKDRGVIPYTEKGNVGNKVSEDLSGYKLVDKGDFVLNSMNLYMGSVGVSEYDGVTSTAYIVCKPKENVFAGYYNYLIQFKGFQEYVGFLGKGIMEIREAVRWTALKSVFVPLPDLPTQRAIADFLDHESARIDSLIEKKQRLVDMIAPRFEALIHVARETGDWQRFGYSAQTIMRPIPLSSGAAYVPLGLYNRGRGFFQKPETAYDDLGDSSFCFVRKGDLVFSGQFAWEGAVGLVSDKEHDCVVSHRYPVYTGIEGILSEYLFAYFRSHHGQFLMDNCSRGAAGRNRPLNTRILEKEKIPVPSIELQKKVATLIEFERRLKDKTAPSIDRLKEYRSALITSAVTGQIDVSTYARSGTTDRQLDEIQSEMN